MGDAFEYLVSRAPNVLDNIIGAVVLVAVAAAIRAARDIWAQFRFRISGTYVTRTTGTAWLGEGAAPSPVERRLRLKQAGSKVWGREAGQGERAEWLIEADLTKDGFLLGRYKQKIPPTGISRGAFYLEQEKANPRRFNGRWTGWQARDRAIASGEYVWEEIEQEPLWRSVLPW